MIATLGRRFFALVLVAAVLATPVAPVAAAEETTAPLIVIDPGHGGPYSNANANGLREKTVNLQIALELRSQLQARGYRVAMTRTTDRAVTLSDIPTWNLGADGETWYHTRDGHRGIYKGIPKDDLQARSNVANRLGADLFISIHNNGSVSRAARGTETIASSRDPLGTKLAAIVHRRIVTRTGLVDRGVKSMDLYVCRWTNAPSILVEGAFISNPSDAYKLKQRWFRRRIALGIAEGVDAWFDTKPITKVYPRALPSTPSTSPAAPAASAAVSQRDFPAGAPAVVLARSDRWADAAPAPALARRLGGPLLWVSPSELDTVTAQEIDRLRPGRVVLFGVEGSFDTTLTSAIASAAAGVSSSSVESVTAPTRSALAAAVATTMGPSPSGQVILVDARDTRGLLTAAPVAAKTGIPLVLTDGGALSAEAASAIEAIGPSRVVLAGPAEKLPSNILPAVPSTRIDGRYVTLRADYMNARYYRQSSMRPVIADIAFGAEYLTAAHHASLTGAPVVPVTKGLLPVYTRHWIVNRRPQIVGYEILDARGTIGPALDRMLQKADR